MKHRPFGNSKEGNIARDTEKELKRRGEPSFKRRLMGRTEDGRWMQHASKKPGWTREFLSRNYGSMAFNADGTIKESVLQQAIDSAKKRGAVQTEKRLVLAKTYKKYAYA